MNNNDLVSRSEVRKMIEEEIKKLDDRRKINEPNGINEESIKIVAVKKLLSELDKIEGVSGWIPVTEKNKFEI